MLYPLTFDPLLKERVWGGRQLERLYRKPLPEGQLIGESWEISDRPKDVSVVSDGILAGTPLNRLVETSARELMGNTPLAAGRFPLLIKILDAREKLSLQVHPPARVAATLGGEPKTEMWYIAHAEPGAELYVGLKRGATREEFERRLRTGDVEQCFHRIPVHSGDAMFLPSGRVHAIGAGLVIFEIQQNSDTTYRVFDWNRKGLDGKPRETHIAESLASIDFEDFEPELASPGKQTADVDGHRLVSGPLFTVDLMKVLASATKVLVPCRMQIVGVVSGNVRVFGGDSKVELSAGQFCLVPACLEEVRVQSTAGASVLRVEGGQG